MDAAAAARISKAAEIGDAQKAVANASVAAAATVERKTASVIPATPAAPNNTMMYIGGGVLVAAVCGIVAVVLSKKK